MALCEKLFETANKFQKKRLTIITKYLTAVCEEAASEGEFDVEIFFGHEISTEDNIRLNCSDITNFAEQNNLDYSAGTGDKSILVSWRKLM